MVFFLYSFAVLFYSIVHFKDPKWLIFLTNWGNTVIVIYFSLGILINFQTLKRKSFPDNQNSEIQLSSMDSTHDVTFREISSATVLPLKFQCFWLFAYFAYTINGLIVILYWVFVHRERFMRTTESQYFVIHSHGVTYLLVLIDFLLSQIPVRVLHLVYVVLFGLLYGLFSFVYTSVTGVSVYPVLNWNTNPGGASLFCLIAASVIIILHLILYLMYYLKKKCSNSSFYTL